MARSLRGGLRFPSAEPRPGVPLLSLLGAASMIEMVGGLCMLLGLFARPVAFILAGEMATAYFISHFPRSFWPLVNRGEPAVFFCFTWLYFAAAGAGPWSLDALRGRDVGERRGTRPRPTRA